MSAGVSLPVVQNDDDDTSNSNDSEGDTQYPWTLVQRRCARSLDSANIPTGNKFIRKRIALKGSSNEQKSAVEVAAAALTKEQRNSFIKRHAVAENARVDHDYAEPGPSNLKGKGIDPREWGNLELNEEEMDLMAQEAVLNLYKSPKENTGYEREHPSKKKLKNRSKSRSKKQSAKEKASSEVNDNTHNNMLSDIQKLMRPHTKSRAAAQIAPKSSIGLALNKVKRGQ